MDEAGILEIMQKTFYVILEVSGPVMIAGLVIGVIISIFQTLTSIQEATLTFVPKIIVIFLILGMIFPYIFIKMRDFSQFLFDKMTAL